MQIRNAIVQAALKLVGCGYIYGATGWVCTQKRLDQQARQYPKQAANIYKYGSKWLNRVCFDCAQLVRAAVKAVGVHLPSGSTSQWRAKLYSDEGTIDTMPVNEPAILVFRQQKGSTTIFDHVGLNVGDGTTVEARGHAYGVVQRKLSDGTWTHWKRLTVCAEEIEVDYADVFADIADVVMDAPTAKNAVEDIIKALRDNKLI